MASAARSTEGQASTVGSGRPWTGRSRPPRWPRSWPCPCLTLQVLLRLLASLSGHALGRRACRRKSPRRGCGPVSARARRRLFSPLHTGDSFLIRAGLSHRQVGGVEICARVYRPRRARESPLFRLVEQHLEEFLRVYQERFAKAHGSARPVVERVLRGFMRCWLVEHLWCGTCRTSVLCPFSCRGRSFCPSCEKKQFLWAEWLQQEVLATVPHRHVVLPMPRLLRGIFRKRRDLLGDLAQCSAEALSEYLKETARSEHQARHRRLPRDERRPGPMASTRSPSRLRRRLLGRWHIPPPCDLGRRDGDEAVPRAPSGAPDRAARDLRRLARKLLAWRHPGFSAHIGKAIRSRTRRPSRTSPVTWSGARSRSRNSSTSTGAASWPGQRSAAPFSPTAWPRASRSRS